MSTTKQMKDIGVREFRDHATKYLSGGETLAIRKNGHLIGFYIPIKRDEEEIGRAWERFGEPVDRIVREPGMTEDELAARFDLYKPRKRDEEKVRQAWERFGETVDRILQETGMTEDELADIFDLSKLMPE